MDKLSLLCVYLLGELECYNKRRLYQGTKKICNYEPYLQNRVS